MRPIPGTVFCIRYAVSASGSLTVVDSQLVRGSSSRRRLLYCLISGWVCWNLTGRGRHRKADVFGSGLLGVRKRWMLGLEMVRDGLEW